MLWHEGNGLQNLLTMLRVRTEKVEVDAFEQLAICQDAFDHGSQLGTIALGKPIDTTDTQRGYFL